MYLTIFGISLGAWLLFEVWTFLRDRGKDRGPATGAERRSVTALAIAIALAMNVPGNFPLSLFSGIALVWARMVFRLWCIQTLGRLFSTRLVIQQGHDLVT